MEKYPQIKAMPTDDIDNMKNDIKKLIKSSKKKFGNIDIWINNAGVNQPDKMIW